MKETKTCPVCGKPCKSFTVKKEGANKGREFYTCDHRGTDMVAEKKFFEWADGLGNKSPTSHQQHTPTPKVSNAQLMAGLTRLAKKIDELKGLIINNNKDDIPVVEHKEDNNDVPF